MPSALSSALLLSSAVHTHLDRGPPESPFQPSLRASSSGIERLSSAMAVLPPKTPSVGLCTGREPYDQGTTALPLVVLHRRRLAVNLAPVAPDIREKRRNAVQRAREALWQCHGDSFRGLQWPGWWRRRRRPLP